MIPWRWVTIALACLLLLGLGTAGGVWLGARHYRPKVDAALADLVACRATSSPSAVGLPSTSSMMRNFFDVLPWAICRCPS
ncbi:hypothetical protein I5I60_31845 [Pseudomonas aeruginosa]|nr:hypothetical protein [Pseudomonas aeruginosa]